MSKQRKLSIAYVTHYYPPEVNAPALRVSRLSRLWAAEGHSVSVLTGFPNHPTGVIPGRYAGRVFMRERCDGVDVYRSFVYAAQNKGLLKRVFNYLSFMVSSIVTGIAALPRTDIVIATSPQFFVAISGWVISVFRRAQFVFEVRDVWPEEIVAVGAIRNKSIVRILEWIEAFLYRRASTVVAVSNGTIETLVSRGVSRQKIALMPNGIDIDEFEKPTDTVSLRKQLSLDGEFIVSYIGTHGMAHRLDTVLSAAGRFIDNRRIKFIMLGDGAEKNSLMSLSEEMGLDNVLFLPQLPHEQVLEYYKISDVCLVPLRKASLFTRNIPSKIYEIMASARPILIGTNGESRKLVEDARAGIAFEPENVDELVRSISTLYENRKLARRMGRNGYAYASRNCRREVIAADYVSHLNRIAGLNDAG